LGAILLERGENTATFNMTLDMPLPLLRAGAERPCSGRVLARRGTDRVKENRRT